MAMIENKTRNNSDIGFFVSFEKRKYARGRESEAIMLASETNLKEKKNIIHTNSAIKSA